MIVVPAVDLRRGKVVRLREGRPSDETVYGDDPVETARAWAAQGALRLHVVDLDGAIDGKPQTDVVGAIIAAAGIPVEAGGGIRTREQAARYIERGVDRVIFGTAALAAPEVVERAARDWGGKVAVALDAREGMAVVVGWRVTSAVSALDLAARIRGLGVTRLQYTDVTRDGMLVGPNLEQTAAIARASGLRITAAGGVSTLDDIRRTAALAPLGVDEVIVGKALYERRFTLAEAIAATTIDDDKERSE
ncbi:MAG: 1-(5-phosphoribosyl)-5-[(5-phosphoribosylamino)methylideneamino]imidazole-4-carboxamide isomerase [Vicinamibacteria bacterium]|nr:1-(5-phosphoribosyl)-5-[(5-phosphoribosylamino)methylideneamino]imidazole-4-carboxamide isomerase [Vicinamibacteria bacterium]